MTIGDRIRRDIEARILAGEWRPGDRIPFEHELVARYGCARATVGKALAGLVRAGLIERRRKAGSFVAHPHARSAVLAIPDLEAMIAARGEAYSWRRTGRRIGSARRPAEDDLGPDVLHIDGVHCAGGAPFAIERRLVSLAAAPAAADEPFDRISPGGWLVRHVPWTRARHGIAAVAATRAEAAALAVRPASHCLAIRRETWRGGDMVTRVRQLFPGDRLDLVAEFGPGDAQGTGGG